MRLSPSALSAILNAWPDIPPSNAGCFSPENLAIIHSYTHGSTSSEFLFARERLKNQLIATTLNHAKLYIPAYGRGGPKDLSTVEISSGEHALKQVKPTDRAEVQNSGSDYVARNTGFLGATFTSGSSNGVPLLCERSPEEVDWLQRYHLATTKDEDQHGSEPLCLAITTANHGFTVSLPGRGYTFPVDLRERAAFPRAQWLLQNCFSWDGYDTRVRFIVGSFRKVYLLGLFLASRGILPSKQQIKGIQTYGSYAAPSLKKQLERWFGCKLTDVYSLAEFVGSATYCEECGGFHMPPLWYTELECTNEDTSIGELLVTPLYPGAQRFLPLRYRTGDLFVIKKPNCSLTLPAYQYCGRKGESIFPRHWQGRCIPSVFASNALAKIPDISRDRTNSLEGLLDASAGKAPEFEFKCTELPSNLIRLTIKLTYEPLLFPERVLELTELILSNLGKELSSAYGAESSKQMCSEIDLRFLGPLQSINAPDVR